MYKSLNHNRPHHFWCLQEPLMTLRQVDVDDWKIYADHPIADTYLKPINGATVD